MSVRDDDGSDQGSGVTIGEILRQLGEAPKDQQKPELNVIAGGATGHERDWLTKLERYPKGRPCGGLLNAALAMEHASELKGLVRLNAFTQERSFSRMPAWDVGLNRPRLRPVVDDDITELRLLLTQRYDIPCGMDDVRAIVAMQASRESFDPLVDYLTSLEGKWDGNERCNRWLHRYLDVPFNPTTSAIGRRWLVQAVARALSPGCKADYVLVLGGPQGIGKSGLLRLLAPHEGWYLPRLPEISKGNVRLEMTMQGHWIVEMGELAAIRRADAEDVKEFLTTQVDKYVPLYARSPLAVPRRTVFAATTNAGAYLRGADEHRRFWCVESRIPAGQQGRWKEIPADRDQIWAEAVALYRSGTRWDPPEEEYAALRQLADDHREEDPWQDAVRQYCDGREQVTLSEVMGALGFDTMRRDRIVMLRAVECLKAMKWDKVRLRNNDAPGGSVSLDRGLRRYVYRPSANVLKTQVKTDDDGFGA